MSVAAYRVPVQRSRLVDVRVRFKRPAEGTVQAADGREVAAAFERFDRSRGVRSVAQRRAISRQTSGRVGEVGEDGERERPPPRVGTPRPKDDCEFEDGHLGGEHRRDGRVLDAKFCVVVSSVVGRVGRGAAQRGVLEVPREVVRPAPRAELTGCTLISHPTRRLPGGVHLTGGSSSPSVAARNE